MNSLKGTITNVESADSLSLVDIRVGSDTLSSLVLETPQTSPFIAPGRNVVLAFKETEVSIGKDFHCRLSLRNRLRGVVTEVEKGKVLSRISLDYQGNKVVSIITSRSATRLEIAVGDEVEGLVKANEMMIMEVDDGAV